MLSRIAESMFWIGRYVERAEDTARILDVQLQVMLEDPLVEEHVSARSVLAIMGVDTDPDSRPGRGEVLARLAYDPLSPTSIAAALAGARESARRARETLSEPLWEALNTTYRAIPAGQFRSMRSSATFRWVRERAALINGTADATMTRDERWHFLMLGRCIERADMTSRLIATSAVSAGGPSAATDSRWASTLRACGAYEAFLRTQPTPGVPHQEAEFLLLDRLFPRSVVFSLARAEQCLANIETGGRRGFENEAQRLLGRMRSELEYQTTADVARDLPASMERLQRTCAQATEVVTRRYFAGAEALYWHGLQG